MNSLGYFFCAYVFLACQVFAVSPVLEGKDDRVIVRDVRVEEVIPALKRLDAIAVDVRTNGEYIKGHIEGAKNIDFLAESFREQLMSLDKETTYIVYCKSGSRSKKALEEFERLGFKHILHLQSGYDSWVSSKYAERN